MVLLVTDLLSQQDSNQLQLLLEMETMTVMTTIMMILVEVVRSVLQPLLLYSSYSWLLEQCLLLHLDLAARNSKQIFDNTLMSSKPFLFCLNKFIYIVDK